jgi:hypothetical protein
VLINVDMRPQSVIWAFWHEVIGIEENAEMLTALYIEAYSEGLFEVYSNE